MSLLSVSFSSGHLASRVNRGGEESLESNNMIVMFITLVPGCLLKGFWAETKASMVEADYLNSLYLLFLIGGK